MRFGVKDIPFIINTKFFLITKMAQLFNYLQEALFNMIWRERYPVYHKRKLLSNY